MRRKCTCTSTGTPAHARSHQPWAFGPVSLPGYGAGQQGAGRCVEAQVSAGVVRMLFDLSVWRSSWHFVSIS